MHCYVSLGSNQGDPVSLIRQAVAMMGEGPGIEVVRVSDLYRSEPRGVSDQPWYVNAVAELSTELAPLELLRRLQAIESDLGRIRSGRRWAPRTMDIDILLLGERILNLPDLVVPHPRMHLRRFVLEPLSMLEPDLHIPARGSVSMFLHRVSDQDVAPLQASAEL